MVEQPLPVLRFLSAIFAFGFSVVGGLGKEWYDENVKKTSFDERDLKWTIITSEN